MDSKVNGKTVTRILTDDQLVGYQLWFDNQYRLRELIAELETLSQENPAPVRTRPLGVTSRG